MASRAGASPPSVHANTAYLSGSFRLTELKMKEVSATACGHDLIIVEAVVSSVCVRGSRGCGAVVSISKTGVGGYKLGFRLMFCGWILGETEITITFYSWVSFWIGGSVFVYAYLYQ